ncbi:DUF2147 domain-containing protein [Variovorax sp. ZT4R33]|uniref:DUF2147 domain-containing protein n=1 Tax=Variovorax sp. ZT4R33 TaxID=3443743 RepID=UPI003F46901C
MKAGFAFLALLLLVSAGAAMAQTSPVGLWRSIDDKTGEAKAEIRIEEAGGTLAGRIEKTLKKDTKPDAVCDECTDDRKGKPIVGLEIIRGNKILDPENGKEYRAGFTPIDGGRKLEVRGYLGPFWRTQVWTRVQ